MIQRLISSIFTSRPCSTKSVAESFEIVDVTDDELSFIRGGTDPWYGTANDGTELWYQDNLGTYYNNWSDYYNASNGYQSNP